MLALVVLVISIGVVDSLNPSTIAPALYLAAAKEANRSLAGFALGVFAVYLLGGLVLLLGPGAGRARRGSAGPGPRPSGLDRTTMRVLTSS